MDNKEKLIKDMDKLREMTKDKIYEAYIDGVKAGAVLTAATIYRTMALAGLDENNILFIILKDLAKANGCDDLKAYIENMNGDKKNA